MLQNIRSIQEDLPIKKGVSLSINWVYPAVVVKETNSLPAFEFTSPIHLSLHLVLKSPTTTEQNGDVSSIFYNVKWKLWQ